MNDDIDEEHNLSTKARYNKAMEALEASQVMPCVDCTNRPECDIQKYFYCEKVKSWRKTMHY